MEGFQPSKLVSSLGRFLVPLCYFLSTSAPSVGCFKNTSCSPWRLFNETKHYRSTEYSVDFR